MKSQGDLSDNEKSMIEADRDVHNAANDSEESLFAFYDIKSTSNISIVSTNLPSETENKLQEVLLQKLQKSSDDPSANNSGMFRLNMLSGPLSCYYHIVAQPSILTSDLKANEFIHVASQNSLLVLASPWEGLFELFSAEVESWFSNLQMYMDKNSLIEHLQSWHQVCVEYITRTIKVLSVKDLTTVLEVALRLGNIKIENTPDPLASDLQKFLECCSFSLLDNSPDERNVLAVYNGSTNSFTSTLELSSLSESWASELSSADPNIPVKVRQTIEWFKLKGIQDLNTLKRHMKKAVNDYYSLFEAHQFISKTGCPHVLLTHASKENDTTPEDQEIICTLREHLSFKLS